jgi:hypothetical protein
MEGSLRMDFPIVPLESVEIEVYPDKVVMMEKSTLTGIRRTTRGSRRNWRAGNIIITALLMGLALSFAYLWVQTGIVALLVVAILPAGIGLLNLALFLWLETGGTSS